MRSWRSGLGKSIAHTGCGCRQFCLSDLTSIRGRDRGGLMARDSRRDRDLRMLAIELAAGRKLDRKLQQLLWQDMAHFEADGFEFAISFVLFLRAERTFSSIRTLARLRNVDDAFALVRVMVEKIINAEYILLKGTDTALDYIQYHAFREWRDLQSITPELVPKYAAAVIERLRDAHDRA